MSVVNWSACRARFPAVRRWTYLNTAGGGAVSDAVAAAGKRYFDDFHQDGDTHWPDWRARTEAVRALAAETLNAAARECEICPRGPRPNGPPLMIGSSGKRMLSITLPHVDSWNAWLCDGASSADEVPARRTVVDEACRAVGRDPAEVGRSVSIMVDQTGARDIPESMSPRTAIPLSGSPEEIAEGMRAFAGQGIDHLQVSLAPNTVRSTESFAAVLEAFDG